MRRSLRTSTRPWRTACGSLVGLVRLRKSISYWHHRSNAMAFAEGRKNRANHVASDPETDEEDGRCRVLSGVSWCEGSGIE